MTEEITIRGHTVDAEEFVFIWQKADDVEEVRNNLGFGNIDEISNSDISSVASRIRQYVPGLKTMPRGTRLDYDSLKRALDWMQSQNGEATYQDYLRAKNSGLV